MGLLSYFGLVLIVQFTQTDAQKDDYCTVKNTGTLELNKVHVPGLKLPARMKKAVARVPENMCGDQRRQVGVSAIACDVVPYEVPQVTIVTQRLVRVQRQGYAWLSAPGDLIIMVSCEDVPKEIGFPEPDWR